MNCVFCEDNGRVCLLPNGNYDRTIYEDDSWLIYPTIGAFVEGYILHVLKRHTISGFECSRKEINTLSSNIRLFYNTFRKAYHAEYAYVFEHGNTRADRISTCCIDHTHIHMLPSIIDKQQEIKDAIRGSIYPASSLSECYQIIKEKGLSAYILWGDVSRQKYYVIDDSRGLYPSQYMRMLMYSILTGKSISDYGWDWRKNPCYSNLIRTSEKMKSSLMVRHSVLDVTKRSD